MSDKLFKNDLTPYTCQNDWNFIYIFPFSEQATVSMKGEESPFLRKGSNWKDELWVCYLNLIQKHVKTDSILQNSGPAPVRQNCS